MKLRKAGTKKLIIIGVHILVWAIMLVLPAYIITGDSSREKAFLQEVWFQIFFYCILFYISYLWIIPRFFFSKSRYFFFLITALLIILMTLVTGFFIQKKRGDFERFDRQRAPLSLSPREGRAEMPPPPLHERKSRGPKAWPLVSFALTSILVSGLSLGLRFSEKLSQNEKLRKEAEKERADQELILLKNQINPHFLFNTLNTIYSLALVNSEHTAEAVMKLSDMMRYVLQDVNREKVPVTLELDYIRHYVGLQQLRLNRNITVILEIDDDGGGQEIAPILLVPFVENVFKHGISAHEAAEILIRIRCQGNAVELKTVNRIFPDRIQEEVSGIGLTNTKKRLELIYPGSHTLALDDSGGVFTVNLVVRL